MMWVDRQLARAAHDAVVAEVQSTSRSSQHFLALAARIIMNSSCGGCSHALWKLVGQEPEQTPHCMHISPSRHLDLFFDFLQEIVAVFLRHCGVCAHVVSLPAK